MTERFERQSDNGLTFDDTFDSKVRNEIYVLMAGGLGAFGELKRAASEAAEQPGTAAIEMGAAALVGAGLGYASQRAGVYGLAARGLATALGVSFVFEGLRPWGKAMEGAWDARTSYQINHAASELSRSTGKILFDTLITAPFAVGGAFAGRGLRSALTETVAAEAPKVSRPAAPEAPRAQFSTNTSGRRAFEGGFQGRAQAPRTEPFTRRPEVLVGEIVEAEPRRTTAREASPRVEIIDAEFTVVEMPEHALPGRSSNLPAVRLAGDAPVVIVHQPSLNQFNVVINQGNSLTLNRALTELRRFEPAWTMDSGALVSPQQSRMTPEHIARVLKAYSNWSTPEPGSIINIRV